MVQNKTHRTEYVDGTVYDEAYYEHGGHGSPYQGYTKSLLEHPGLKEYAKLIVKKFQPQSVLEVGCATGIIVRHLRDMGVNVTGIDISEYATKNAVTHGVLQASATDLPFADDSFDLTFGCHCIEHIPPFLLEPAIAEQARVSRRWVFHVMPIWKLGPYQWSRQERETMLQSDITDLNLEDPVWWINKFTTGGALRYRPDIRLHGATKLWTEDYNYCQLCFEKEPLEGAAPQHQSLDPVPVSEVSGTNGSTALDLIRATLPYRAARKIYRTVRPRQ